MLLLCAFSGKDPPKYQDHLVESRGTNPYATPDAAALVSLLQKEEQHVVCGKIDECDDESHVLLCYFHLTNAGADSVTVK